MLYIYKKKAPVYCHIFQTVLFIDSDSLVSTSGCYERAQKNESLHILKGKEAWQSGFWNEELNLQPTQNLLKPQKHRMTYRHRQADWIRLFMGECEGETHRGEGGEWEGEGGREGPCWCSRGDWTRRMLVVGVNEGGDTRTCWHHNRKPLPPSEWRTPPPPPPQGRHPLWWAVGTAVRASICKWTHGLDLDVRQVKTTVGFSSI